LYKYFAATIMYPQKYLDQQKYLPIIILDLFNEL